MYCPPALAKWFSAAYSPARAIKDALVRRCSAGQDEKGEWLQVTYFDEDGANVRERFRLHTRAQRRLFALRFLPLHLRAVGMPFAWRGAEDIEAAADKLRAPDFVVARRRGHFWQVREKVFDYQGRFRRAHELRG